MAHVPFPFVKLISQEIPCKLCTTSGASTVWISKLDEREQCLIFTLQANQLRENCYRDSERMGSVTAPQREIQPTFIAMLNCFTHHQEKLFCEFLRTRGMFANTYPSFAVKYFHTAFVLLQGPCSGSQLSREQIRVTMPMHSLSCDR